MAKDKLKKVNVPELFHKHFLADRPVTSGSVLELLSNIAPSARGRGFTRVIPEVTQTQYDELYGYAAEARAAMPGAERDTVLRAAICGKALAERMEKAGVSNPVNYAPTRTRKNSTSTPTASATPVTSTAPATPAATTAAALTAMAEDATEDEDADDTSLNSVVPAEPVSLDTVEDLEEVSDEELDGFGEDISYG